MGGGPAEARAGQTFGRYPLGREIVKENPLRPREGAVAEGAASGLLRPCRPPAVKHV